jgi:MoaA/NifB/PqqE/SkfB family radical SAM enzyme
MLKEILTNFIIRDKKWCFFAIDNVCNNRCEMCGIWKDTPKMVSLEDAKVVIDKLHDNNFNVLQLTGGEPLLNPNFLEIVKYAKKLKFLVFAPTNGTLIDKDMARRIKDSKIDQVSVSLHHYKPEVFDKISGREGILKLVIESIENLKDEKVAVSALCTISKNNINDLEGIVKLTNKLDVMVSFCLPMSISSTSFKLGGEGDCVNLSNEEMRNALIQVISLKKKGYNIVNSFDFLLDMVRHLNGESRHGCFGGNKLLYIDWNLNVFPCMSKGEPVSIDKYDFKNSVSECKDCMIQCFREPSMLMVSRKKTTKIMIKEVPFQPIMAYKRMKTLLK